MEEPDIEKGIYRSVQDDFLSKGLCPITERPCLNASRLWFMKKVSDDLMESGVKNTDDGSVERDDVLGNYSEVLALYRDAVRSIVANREECIGACALEGAEILEFFKTNGED